MPDNYELNPLAGEFHIGIHHKRKIKIYPLSIYDQTKMMGQVKQALMEFFDKGVKNAEKEELGIDNTALLVSVVSEVIKKNLVKILSICIECEDLKWWEKLLMKWFRYDVISREVSNDQLVAIGKYIFKVNFEGPAKNALGLPLDQDLKMEKILNSFGRLKQQFVNGTDTL
jgi:hypothetical protein